MSSPSPVGNKNNNEIPLHETFRQGLLYEIFIMQNLLKQHRCNHGRTLYYRRLEMTMKCICKKYNTEIGIQNFQKLQNKVNEYVNEHNKRKRQRKTDSQRTQEEWTIDNATKNDDQANMLTGISQELTATIHFWTLGIEEIVSRTYHASHSLIIEIRRGFFLPFCSVAFAAIARIRSMILDITKCILPKLYNLQSELLEVIQQQKKGKQQVLEPKLWLLESDYSKYMNMFMDNEKDTGSLENNINAQLDQSVMLANLGLTEASVKSKTNKSATTVPTAEVRLDNNNNQQVTTKENGSANVNGVDHDHDLGESVVPPHVQHVLAKDDSNTAKSQPTQALSTTIDATIDRNMIAVDNFKKQKIDLNDRKQSKGNEMERIEPTDKVGKRKFVESSDTTTLKSKKKSKKKKKKPKENFFDELFDS